MCVGEDDVVTGDPWFGIGLVATVPMSSAQSNRVDHVCRQRRGRQQGWEQQRRQRDEGDEQRLGIDNTWCRNEENLTHGANCAIPYPNTEIHQGSLNVNQCLTRSPNRSKQIRA